MNTILMKIFAVGVFVVPYLSGCNDLPSSDLQAGMLRDMTGLDGCTWMIETIKNDKTIRLEPINLDDFSIVPIDSLSVSFAYKSADVATICMAGEVIELTKIEVR